MIYPRQAHAGSGLSVLGGSVIQISKKRLDIWATSVLAALIVWAWAIAFPRKDFSLIPPDKLVPVTGKQFVNETVVLDGKDFEDCTFAHVTLRFEGKHNFTLSNNHFVAPMRLSWSSDSAKQAAGIVVALLQQANLLDSGKVGMIGDGDMVFANPPTPGSPQPNVAPLNGATGSKVP